MKGGKTRGGSDGKHHHVFPLERAGLRGRAVGPLSRITGAPREGLLHAPQRKASRTGVGGANALIALWSEFHVLLFAR